MEELKQQNEELNEEFHEHEESAERDEPRKRQSADKVRVGIEQDVPKECGSGLNKNKAKKKKYKGEDREKDKEGTEGGAKEDVLPPEIWQQILLNRTWPASRTIMLRMTSKTVKEVVDRVCPPAVVRLKRSFWNNASNGTVDEKLKRILAPLAAMPARCRITKLQLPHCEINNFFTKNCLKGVLARCPLLAHLDLRGNAIRANGAGWLAKVLPRCPALAHLDLSRNRIGNDGAGRIAGVLAQCPALAHVDLSDNGIGSFWLRSLRASWHGQASCLLLEQRQQEMLE